MRLLLDTHCWLWMSASPRRFRPEVLELLLDPATELFLSAASAWEIAVKWAIGRLPLPDPPAEYVPRRMEQQGVVGLPVHHRHALHVATLPPLHRDPFDRLLVAQARLEGLALLTADPKIRAFDGFQALAP